MDWGERRIGLAISDPTGLIASPLPTLTIRGREDGVTRVLAAAKDREAERIVVGLPLLMSGERGEAAQSAELFAQRLREASSITVEMYDERLTSALSERRLHETGVRTGHHRERIDAGAAVALLESFLQRLAARGENG